MSDPRFFGPQQRKANHSQLMQALSKASLGEVVNFCPFGCANEELDDNGYCKHLVGFSNDGKTLEPMRRRKGRRMVQVKRERTLVGTDDEGQPEYDEGPPQYEAVLPGDKLERITTSYRVYRDVAAQITNPAEPVVQAPARQAVKK